MTYTPPEPPLPAMVSLYAYGALPAMANGPSSAIWESANRAVYFPVILPGPCVLRRFWWVNGATVGAYNIDAGIYADDGHKPGAKLVSTGSTAQGTASEVQFADVTDTALAPGLYWLAMVVSSTSATFLRFSLGAYYDALLRFEQASALPLPATATPVETTGSNLPLFGFATTASP